MKMLLTYRELNSTNALVEKVLRKTSTEYIKSSSLTLDNLRAAKDPAWSFDDVNEVAIMELPEELYTTVAGVITKHFDTIVPVVDSIVNMTKSLISLMKAFNQDMKEEVGKVMEKYL
jgi:hypothetical protein